MRGPLLIVGVCAAAAGCTLLVDANGLSDGAAATSNDAGPVDGSVDGQTTPRDGSSSADGATSGDFGPVSTGLSSGARINCAGGKFDCTPPGQACCLIMGNQLDFCVDQATAAADCKSSMGYPTAIITCNDEGDCPAGNACCIGIGDTDKPVTSSVCAPTCPAGQFPMCRTGGAPCPAGKTCGRISVLETLSTYGYRVCN